MQREGRPRGDRPRRDALRVQPAAAARRKIDRVAHDCARHLLERVGKHDVRMERPRQRLVLVLVGAIFPEAGQDSRFLRSLELRDKAQERGRASKRGRGRDRKLIPGTVTASSASSHSASAAVKPGAS
jgi:hypothetical protein